MWPNTIKQNLLDVIFVCEITVSPSLRPEEANFIPRNICVHRGAAIYQVLKRLEAGTKAKKCPGDSAFCDT